jgi:stage V sporulation protein R
MQTSSTNRSLSPELAELYTQIEKYARGCGLDFYDTVFEVLDFEEMNMVAAYGGFPNRYPHWKFGMEFERLNKSYAYGLHKIYEMVINNDPCYAYLLECNNATTSSIRSSSWRTFSVIATSSRTTSGSRKRIAK